MARTKDTNRFKESSRCFSKDTNKMMDITPMARWDWIRWIRSTKQQETCKRRIENALAMLKSGKRRPCFFNRNICTEPYISNNGVLLEQNQTMKVKMNKNIYKK